MTDLFSAILSACADPVALFIDFDGTLVEIAPHPDAVHVPTTLIDRLGSLETWLGGALAIITGRTIADIDSRFSPHTFPIAGSHGAELRLSGRSKTPSESTSKTASAIAETLSAELGEDGLVFIERKPTGVAVHFRAAPERENEVRAAMHRVLEPFDGFHAVDGKKVIEARPGGVNKGRAITALMDEPPFHGRTPIFIGDDVTDEDGFRAVNEMDGISIKVGAGETAARFRLPDVSSVHIFLDMLTAEPRSREATL